MRVLLLMLAACASAPQPSQKLPAPHLGPVAIAPLRVVADLHTRIGARDQRDPIEAVLGWAGELGMRTDAESLDELLAWAERTHRLHDTDESPQPGDLLIFAHDVVGIAIARDARGVTEIVYLAGGIVRRGFVDPTRPSLRRDRDGAIVNTYLRHGKRNDRQSRDLAGKLLANIVRMR